MFCQAMRPSARRVVRASDQKAARGHFIGVLHAAGPCQRQRREAPRQRRLARGLRRAPLRPGREGSPVPCIHVIGRFLIVLIIFIVILVAIAPPDARQCRVVDAAPYSLA